MATDAKELERVGRIHDWLDYLAKTGVSDSGGYINDGERRHSYTAAEVRAWPETKAKMRESLSSSGNSRAIIVTPLPGFVGCVSGYYGAGSIEKHMEPYIARGLCMYREQLSDALSPGRALTEDGSVRVNEEQAEALKTKEDPYTAWRHSQGATFAAQLEGRTVEEFIAEQVDRYSVGRGDRKRLVAALAVELSKPVTLRFPAEGRSDRALSVTNGMIRGRE